MINKIIFFFLFNFYLKLIELDKKGYTIWGFYKKMNLKKKKKKKKKINLLQDERIFSN